jgi:hypothetical protein
VQGQSSAPDIEAALASLSDGLRARFPEAEFSHRKSPDGLRWYLDVATDSADDFDVLEVVAGATIDLFLTYGILVHVFPFRRAALRS